MPALIVDLPARQHLQPVEQGGRLAAAMRLDQADDDIDAVRLQPPRPRQHGIGLADAGRGAEKQRQPAAPSAARKRQQRVGIGSPFQGCGSRRP